VGDCYVSPTSYVRTTSSLSLCVAPNRDGILQAGRMRSIFSVGRLGIAGCDGWGWQVKSPHRSLTLAARSCGTNRMGESEARTLAFGNLESNGCKSRRDACAPSSQSGVWELRVAGIRVSPCAAVDCGLIIRAIIQRPSGMSRRADFNFQESPNGGQRHKPAYGRQIGGATDDRRPSPTARVIKSDDFKGEHFP
jgi:hypothetical protein